VEISFLLFATAVTAFIVGGWLMAVVTTAATSHWQRRMHKQVMVWQTRAMRAENPGWRRD
jgi:hypothetical protein